MEYIDILYTLFAILILVYILFKWRNNITFKYISSDERQCRKCGGHQKRVQFKKLTYWTQTMPYSVDPTCYCNDNYIEFNEDSDENRKV